MDVRERRREEKGGSSGSSSSNNGKSSSSGSSSSSFKNLNYYPLAGQAGERFPTCDPNKQKVLTPRPPRRGDYLRGILEGIARVEKEGYDVLNELGADDLVEVRTAGGGAKNEVWTRMRGRILGVPTAKAEETEAAYGAALLALKTLLPPYPPPSLLGEGDEA
jgi:sugar (pentulose or hexulose) kinase